MKSKLILSATLALMVSSSAFAGKLVGEQFGASADPQGTQCTAYRTEDKPQAKAKVTHDGSSDSSGDQGRTASARSAG
jgi:hypothetical protein